MMKYSKAIFGVFILTWVATMIMGNRIKPGSFFYPVRVQLNEPLWVWVHITAPGRATAMAGVLDTHYMDVERAWLAQDEKQMDAAVRTVRKTTDTVIATVYAALTAGNYTVADSLAASAGGMARIHGRILETLVVHGTVVRNTIDIGFISDTAVTLQQLRAEEVRQFSAAYSKNDLIRGIDAHLQGAKHAQEGAEQEVQNVNSILQPFQKKVLLEILTQTRAGYEEAKNKLGTDQYVESFVLANTVKARIYEVLSAVRATRELGVPVVPAESSNL